MCAAICSCAGSPPACSGRAGQGLPALPEQAGFSHAGRLLAHHLQDFKCCEYRRLHMRILAAPPALITVRAGWQEMG